MNIIYHYSEIGLKGNNRRFFEEKLMENIRSRIDEDFYRRFKRISGRLVMTLTEKGEKNKESIKERLRYVFGLANFSFAREIKQDIEEIKKSALEILQREEFKTFKIFTQRSNKNFNLTSPAVNRTIGEFIVKNLNKQVNLEKPDITLFIEIADDKAFVYLEKATGQGGLPVGVSGHGLALLSDGIDSPVAAWQMMKRGMKISFIHFYSYLNQETKAIEKIKKMVAVLNKYQGRSTLYLIPFKEIQKNILGQETRDCCLICKRTMLKIASEIAKKEHINALITGDSLGQVASQTIENMRIIEEEIDLTVLRPLIGFDKQETIKKAQEIGTYDISIIPTNFYCQQFLPRHPRTKGNLRQIKQIEEKLKIKIDPQKMRYIGYTLRLPKYGKMGVLNNQPNVSHLLHTLYKMST